MKYIDLEKYPTIGEVVFADDPEEVYINRYALPAFARNRQVLFALVHNPDRAENPAQSVIDQPLQRKSSECHLLQFPERMATD